MLYNYPGRTGVDMTPEFIERLAELKNIRYVKESTGEMRAHHRLLLRAAATGWASSAAAIPSPGEPLVGAVGWVGGVANVAAEVPRRALSS